jgi:hypothetical protein
VKGEIRLSGFCRSDACERQNQKLHPVVLKLLVLMSMDLERKKLVLRIASLSGLCISKRYLAVKMLSKDQIEQGNNAKTDEELLAFLQRILDQGIYLHTKSFDTSPR